MASKSQKNRELLVDQLEKNGWEKDRWGHYKKEIDGEVFRVKMQKISFRYERKIKGGWFNRVSGYFSKIEITDDGVIEIKGKAWRIK